MSIATQIARISGNVADALTAVANKGVTVPTGSTSDDLADLIALIQTGGGGNIITQDQDGYLVFDAQNGDITIIQDAEGYLVIEPESESSYTWETVFDANATVMSDNPNYVSIMPWDEPLNDGALWKITWKGTEYEYEARPAAQSGIAYDDYYIGNPGIVGYTDDGSGATFFGYRRTDTQFVFVTTDTAGSFELKIEKRVLSGGSTLISKTITANGTYDPADDNADGYSQVTVNVTGSVMNVQTAQSTTRRNNTALGSITSLTCSKTGTYDVYWSCARSNTSQTWGSQLYIGGSAYGTENTEWSNHVQNNHLTGVSISQNQTVAVYGRSRSSYYIYVPQLTIVQTA